MFNKKLEEKIYELEKELEATNKEITRLKNLLFGEPLLGQKGIIDSTREIKSKGNKILK